MRDRQSRATRPHPVDAAVYDRAYFLRDCDGYEEFAATRGRVLPERLAKVLRHAEVAKGMCVLDVGCGRGESLLWLARQGAVVWGLDYASDAVHLAAEALRAADSDTRRRCRLLCANARHLPFPEDTFDCVLMLDVVEHLYPWELEQALLEVRGTLRPGGRLVIHTAPNLWYYWFGYPIFRIAERFRGVKLPKDPRQRFRCHGLMHVNEQSPWSLGRALQRCGYRSRVWLLPSAVDEEGSPSRVNRVKKLVQWLPVVRWVFRNDIVAVARKPAEGRAGRPS